MAAPTWHDNEPTNTEERGKEAPRQPQNVFEIKSEEQTLDQGKQR